MKFFEMLLEILPMVYYHYAQHSSAIWQQITETFITGYDLRIVGLLDESPCKICVLIQFNGIPDCFVYIGKIRQNT